MSVSVPETSQGAVAAGLPVNVYDGFTDLNQALNPQQIEAYKQNRLTSFSPAAAVILTIVTFGIFAWIYYPLQHSKLPVVKQDDPSGAKAFWFQLIPLFGIYWYFVMWPRLIDRVNLQFRLRGRPAPVNRQLPLFTFVAGFIAGIGGLVVALVAIAQTQSAINQLAAAHSAQFVAQPAPSV